MALLGVRGIPNKWSSIQIMNALSRAIQEPFKLLQTTTSRGKQRNQTAYIQLSNRSDPDRIRYNIRVMSSTKSSKLSAFVAQSIPAAQQHGGKLFTTAPADGIPRMPQQRGPKKLAKTPDGPAKMLSLTHKGLLSELQVKYPALLNLSRKTGHRLLSHLGQIIMDRLTKLPTLNQKGQWPQRLAAAYRRVYPRFGDFQLIVSSLHHLQDELGLPRTQLQESALLPLPLSPYEKAPLKNQKALYNKYCDRILQKLNEHVSSLNTESGENETEEDIARRRVREEIKKVASFMPIIVRSVLNEHFLPEKMDTYKIYIFGEPRLPEPEAFSAVLKKVGVSGIRRPPQAYNMATLAVNQAKVNAVMALDGSEISGMKLVVRSADIPFYKWVPPKVEKMETEDSIEPTIEWTEDM